MKQEMFVLVKVTYDYYRFQENVFASTSKEECIKYYNDNADSRWKHSLLDYSIDEDVYIKALNQSEEPHYWIQSL